jgi:autotransporter-associated beta strand protein
MRQVMAAKIYTMKTRRQNITTVLMIAVGLLLADLASAASITLTNTDASGSSSFNAKLNWNDTVAPTAANDYVVTNGLVMRTPASSANFTFQGKSLTLSGGGGWFYKSTGNGFVITVGTSAATGLTLNNGRSQVLDGSRSFTLAGFVTLGASGGSFDPFNGTTTVSSQIGGPGALSLSVGSTSTTGGAVVLSGVNTYTGGTVINAADTLRLSGSGTLGATTGSLQFINTGNKGYGFLDLNGTSQGIGNLSGSLTSGTSGAKILNGAASTTSTLTIGNGDTGGGNYPGTITNGAGVLALTKIGTGIITLSGTNNYTGGTTISNGALQMASIAGPLSGAGTLVLMAANTNTPQQISGITNVFSGPLIVKAGWLSGTNNAFGTNHLTVDPNFTLDVSASGATVGAIAVLEPKYDVNSASALTIVNGGIVVLHQNCAFTSVSIEGTPLSAGTHLYSELAANFPNNFLAGGSGAITVQPYGTLPALVPQIATQPASISRYAGYSGQFRVTLAGSSPANYQWQKAGSPLSDGGNISGATTSTLTIGNISAPDAADYSVVATNSSGSVTSSVATLTLLTPNGYESTLVAAAPKAYYRLDETGDPATNNSPAFDHAGGFDGIYGTAAQNGSPNYGIAGPRTTDGFSGFSDTNTAARFFGGTANSHVTIPALNLNTNTVTLTAWINPGGPAANAGVIFCRGSGTVAGLNFTGSFDVNGNRTLGYTWNNEAGTYGWNSQIAPPPNQWSFVALVITPTNATIYIYNANGLLASSQTYIHVNQSFSFSTLIGEDSFSGTRQFDGAIDEVAVFNTALTQNQLTTVYSAASGVSLFGPLISSQPASQNLYEQQTARFTVQASGTQPLSYQWQKSVGGNYVNLSDDSRISGSTTASLTISNLALADATDYVVIVSNSVSYINSTAATLSVNPVSPAETITLPGVQTSGQSWDAAASWSDGLAASVSAVSKPGSTYRVLASGAMRTPGGAASATFPGNQLYVDGNGVFATTVAGSGIGAVIVKSSNGGTVNFKKLVMAGGELLNFIDSGGNAVLTGELNVISNAPVHSSDDTSARSIRIESQLTGNGNIEYHAYTGSTFIPGRVSSLNIAGTNNTYLGTWNVVVGTLVGSITNSLGTNTIIVGTGGALQTTYNINNPNADLVLNGQMNLTQNDTFRSVVVGGVGIVPGTYTFSQLTNAYAANFPATWVGQPGASTVTNGSGSITVLSASAPVITAQPSSLARYEGQTGTLSVTAVGNQTLGYQWKKWNGSAYVSVANGGTISGAQSATLTIANLVTGNAGDYLVVVINSLGSATSSPATLTVAPVGPPLLVTMSAVQPNQSPSLSWDSGTWWDNGQAASLTAVSNPGSTFEISPSGGLRTPAGAVTTNFPGNVLTVSGDGVWNGGGVGQIIFKGASGGTVFFPSLVMNGGQLNNFIDSSGNAVIGGLMNIVANTPISAPNTGSGGSIRIEARLTGNGSIEYHAYAGGTFQPTWVAALTIAGNSNTYSGTWNVVLGTLVGTGANSLGTNTITVGANGALQTSYNINNPQGDLVLNGRMNLTQDDTFHSVTVGGVQLAAGVHTFAQLNSSYPAYFPATWAGQSDVEAATTGSGSINVLTGPAGSVTVATSWSGGSLTLTWPGNGLLLEATNVNGPWTTNNSATSPFTVAPIGPQKFFRLQVQ